MKKLFAAIAAVAMLCSQFAIAAQGTTQLPTSGVYNGATAVGYINAAHTAMSTNQSGSADPGTNGGPYSWWADTGNSLLKLRNGANTGWFTIAPLGSQLAPLASPTFTGTPAAPTASGGTNTTQIATTAFVQSALSSNVAGKASTLAMGGGTGTAMTFNWSGQSGQPSWLWGSNDGVNHYVWNPSNFNVNYANSAGTATSATYVTNGLGIGQNYSGNIAGSRSFGTVYTNGTSKPIFVSVQSIAACSGSSAVAYVNGVEAGLLSPVVNSSRSMVYMIVPPGYTYQVNSPGCQTISAWYEMT